VRTPEATGLIEMGAGSLQQLPALPEESLPAVAADPASIGIDRVAFGLLIDPRLWPAIGFADVGANLQRFEIVNGPPAVIALVGHDFFDHRHRVVGDGGNRSRRCRDRWRARPCVPSRRVAEHPLDLHL
jgi:hypothetical protein